MNPENFKIGACSVSYKGSSLGATTTKGVEVTYKPDVHLHKSGQFGSTPVKASRIGYELRFKMVLAEITLDNLEAALAGTDQAGEKLRFGGVAGVALTGGSLVLTPFDGSEAFVATNAVPVSDVKLDYKSDEERLIEVEFIALVDPDAAQAQNAGYLS